MPKSKELISDSESASDDEPKQKKAKQPAEKRPAEKSKAKSSGSGEETRYEIGRMRYVSVSEFRGKKMISIREFYQADDGELRPGKKGISLTSEQWEKLKSHVDDVDSDLKGWKTAVVLSDSFVPSLDDMQLSG